MSASYNLVQALVPVSVATVAIILRIAARIRGKIDFGADDYLVLAAGAFAWTYAGMGIFYSQNSPPTSPKAVENVLKALYVEAQLTPLAFFCAKMSILFLYRRVFGVNRKFLISVYVLMAINTAWCVASFLVVTFRCVPAAAYWAPKSYPDAVCINIETIFISSEIINLVTEFVMVMLPLNMVRKLHLPLRQRIGIGIIFAVGFFTVLASALRIGEGYSPVATADTGAKLSLWGVIQLCTAIVTACLPAYGSLLPHGWLTVSMSQLQRFYSNVILRSRGRSTDNESLGSRDHTRKAQKPSNEVPLDTYKPGAVETTVTAHKSTV